jgi:hypothetical protein
MIVGLLGASVGVPYFTSRASLRGPNDQAPAPPPAAATVTALPAGSTSSSLPLTPPPLSPSAPVTAAETKLPPVRQRSPSAEQALRFDVTKDWVYRSFDRTSSGPTDLGLMAVRVPLVSGTQSASLAGSLTYYFNFNNQVEHITFRGRTGDPSRLIQFLSRSYGLQPVSAPLGEYLYQVADRNGVQSELHTREEGSSSSQRLYSVDLELARPGSQRYLPPRAPQLNIPPAESSPATTAAAESGSSSRDSASSSFRSYFDKVHYASPEEKAPPISTFRWPD